MLLNSTTTDPDRRFKDAAKVLGWGFGTGSTLMRVRALPTGQATD